MFMYYAYTYTRREGIRPPSEITTVPYSSVIDSLNTGDLVLFSGATSSGAIIKFFDNSQFSHVGLVSGIFTFVIIGGGNPH